MKKKYLIILIYSFFISCDSKQELELVVKNKILHYSPIFNEPKDSSDFELIHSVYNRYLNRDDWEKSLNQLQFELKNNTQSKLFIISNEFINERIFENNTLNRSNIYFQIKNKNSDDLNIIGGIKDNFNEPSEEEIRQYIEDSIAMANTIYNSYDDEKRLKNFKVLEPNESILISSTLSLPIPINYDNVLDSNFGIPMYKNNTYLFKLHYILNKKDIETNLPLKILDSLKKENVVIKDISLSSNEMNVISN